MTLDGTARHLWLPCVAAVFGFFSAPQFAQGECLSSSSTLGDTATTVYRCPEQQGTTPRQAPLAGPDQTTVVERGPAEIPWFVPKPAAEAAEPTDPPPQAQAASVEDETAVKPDKKPSTQKKPTRKKLVKLKSAKTKTTKALAAKTKSAKALTAKTKPDRKTAKITTSPEKSDGNTVVWTRKDMPLGNRLVNWLGL